MRDTDRRTTCSRRSQEDDKVNVCKEKDSWVICRDRNASGESVEQTAGGGIRFSE